MEIRSNISSPLIRSEQKSYQLDMADSSVVANEELFTLSATNHFTFEIC